MSIVLVCGYPLSRPEAAESLLAEAGVSRARPSKHEGLSPIDLASKMLVASKIKPLEPAGISQIGPAKVWQALAVDLLVANLDETDWGWSDPNAIYFLDYWCDVDPRMRFCIVYSSLEYAIANLLVAAPADPRAIKQITEQWIAYNEELLHFYHRHKDRSLLVNIEAINKDPKGFLTKCQTGLSLDLSRLHAISFANPGIDAVARLTASILLENTHQKDAVYQELESNADFPSGATTDSVTLAHIACADHHDAKRKIKEAQDLCNQAKADREVLELVAKDRADEIDRHKTALYKQVQKSEEHAAKLAEQELQIAQRENQILHLTQAANAAKASESELVELRNHLLNRIQTLEKDISDLTHERDADRHAAEIDKRKTLFNADEQLEKRALQITDLEKHIQMLELKAGTSLAAVARLQQERDTNKQDTESLLLELREARKQLGTSLHKSQELEETLRLLKIEHNKALASFRDLEREFSLSKANDRQRTDSAELAELRTNVDKAEKEKELILLQLRQVQEELEHYFLKYQELSNKRRFDDAPCGKVASTASAVVPQPITIATPPQPEVIAAQPPAKAKDSNGAGGTSLSDGSRGVENALDTVIDLRHFIDGDNWYNAENDGRWAGPGTRSVLRFPSLAKGRYRLELEIVDAISPDILREMSVHFDSVPLQLRKKSLGTISGHMGPLKRAYISAYKREPIWPVRATGEVEIKAPPTSRWSTLEFQFPKVISPVAKGGNDSRLLAVRLRQVRIQKI